jgi:hypothetical protein
MSDFSELLDKGPKLFVEQFGPVWGSRLWKATFIIAVLAVLSVALTQIGGLGKGVFSTISGWFSPQSTVKAAKPSLPPSESPALAPTGTPSCEVSGGTNYGKIEQNCTK